MPLRIPESALGSRQEQCTAAGALTAAAAAAAALIALACLPAACAESTRTLLTDSFDGRQLNATVWSPFVLGSARVLVPSEGATCGAPINGQGAFILQGGGSSRELQPLLLPPNAAASVQAMRVCDPYSSTQLVLEYSDDEGASWKEAWVASDLPYGALKPYNWTMPPATANKTVLLRFRIPNAAVVLDDWRLEVLWPTPTATQQSNRVLLVDDFEQGINKLIWSPFVYGMARLSGSADNCNQSVYGRNVLAIGPGSFRQLQPFTFAPNASVSVHAVSAACFYYSSDSPILLEYSDDDEATWKEAWSVLPLFGEWRRYSFSLPFMVETYAHLRFRRDPAYDTTSNILLDRLTLEVVWPQPGRPRPPRPATNRTTFLTDDFEREPWPGFLWSNFAYGTARLGRSYDTCNEALYGSYSFVLGPGSYRQLQPMTVPANATWSVHALLSCDTSGYDVTVVLEYSDDGEATWLEAWSPGPDMPLGEWRRYGFNLPLEKDTFVHLRFRRPDDRATQAVVALDQLSLEVVWPQPPAPSILRADTNRTAFLTDDFEPGPSAKGLNATVWSNFTYGTARLGNTADTCGQALYGNGIFVLGPGSYRQLQPMTVPANATWSVHALLACNTYGYDVTVVLEYSDDGEATWLEAWSPGPDMPLGEWRRYGFNLPLETDAFVHLRFRRPDINAREAVVALDRLIMEVVWPQPPAPSILRADTNRTAFLTDDFEPGPSAKGLNATVWSNFTYGTARLGNTADTCGQALYGNGIFVLGPGSYRQLQPMTVPANATWSVHALLACNTYGYDVTVVLEYSDDGEATWLEAWSPGPDMPLGEWRRYGFNLPLETDAFVHLRFRRPDDYAREAVVALDRLIMEVVWPQPPAPCPTRGQTLILFNDFEPSSNRSRSSAQNTAGGLNIPTWSPSESYSGAVRLGNASDACGLDVYGNGSLVFDKQGGGSLQLQKLTVPADATWSVHVGWSCMTGFRRMELALEYYDPVKGGWWSAWRWSIQDPLHNNEWRRYEFTLPQEVPSDRPMALRFRRLDTSKAGVLLLDNLRVTVPTPAGQSDSCSAAVAPPPPTNPPPPSIPSGPTAGATAPSCAEQPASPVCLGNTTAVLCPPVQLPAPLHQMRTGAAVSGGDSSGGNASAIVDGGSRGTDTGTIAGDNAQDAQQQQAVAAVTLGGMWLAGNGSTVYMCVESVPADGRVALCSGIRTPDLVSAGVGTGIRLEPGQENQLQEAAMAAAAAAAADRSAADKEELQPARGSSTAGDSVDGPTGVAADGSESSSSEATAGAIYRLTMGKMAYVAVIDPLGCTATLLSYSEAVGTGEKGGVELVDRLRRAA